MAFKNSMASVAVKDLGAAVRWYSQLLGKGASKPMPELAEWKFEGGGGLQIYALAERAGSGSFTLAVTDIDRHVDELQRLGIDASHRSSGPQVKTVMIVDPDGNHIAFAEAVEPKRAQ